MLKINTVGWMIILWWFAGMVMKIEPIERCINALKAEREYDEVIFTTPDGEQFNQPMANTLSLAKIL